MKKTMLLLAIVLLLALLFPLTTNASAIDAMRGRYTTFQTDLSSKDITVVIHEETLTVNLMDKFGVHVIVGAKVPLFAFKEYTISADLAGTWYNVYRGTNLTLGTRFYWRDVNKKLFYLTASQLW